MTIKPKVEVQLKNIKTFQGHDGTGLNADIFINGLKCLHVYDGANGGDFEYQSYEYHNKKEQQIKANIKYLNEHIESLPDKVFSETLKVKIDLDIFVDELFQKLEEEKILRKLRKKEVDHVIYGLPDSGRYSLQKFIIPLSQIPTANLIAELNRIKVQYFKKGYVFFNTNLKELGVDVEKLI